MRTVLCLVVLSVVALVRSAGAAGDNSLSPYSKTENGWPGPQSTAENSDWPAETVIHRTSKFSVGVTCLGTLGIWAGNSWGGLFEFPGRSGVTYLNGCQLFIGGIIGDDTLVSCSNGIWDYYHEGYTTWIEWEFFPPDAAYESYRSLTPISMNDADAFRAIYVDTFTHESGLHWSLWGHTPLNLEVVQKSYSMDRSPYRNILLTDYTITNIGAEEIRGAYLGLRIDGDVVAQYQGAYPQYFDDLVGSLRDQGVIYFIDNDGDPVGGRFLDSTCTIDALGFRPTRSYPPAEDTNFNWWAHDWGQGGLGYGPRMRGTPDDPFREFPAGVWGPPSDDTTRYYMMSHKEWDYDQVLAPLIKDDDPVWLRPDSQLAVRTARGHDTRGTMTIGPYDLSPGRSFRVVFALFGAEFVHNDPLNASNLYSGRWREFHDNLNFFILRRTADRAVAMTDLLLDPTEAPSWFGLMHMSADSAFFKWDPWVFPDIAAYRIELEPLEEFFPSLSLSDRSGTRLTTGLESYYFPPDRSTGVVTSLEPGRLYVAQMNHALTQEEGKRSAPCLVGYTNEALTIGPVRLRREFAFFDADHSGAKINWEPIYSDQVSYYNIYRAANDQEAAQRFVPFIAPDSAVDLEPVACRDIDGVSHCYYRMAAYDSVFPGVTEYIDRNPIEGGCYWVTVVTDDGLETPFSELVKCEKVSQPEREIVVVLGTTAAQSDYVFADSVVSFYDSILSGYDYDLYYWTDTNLVPATCNDGYCTDWRDLAAFKLIIVEEFPSPRVLANGNEEQHKLLTRLIDAGRNVAYFGTPPGESQLSLNSVQSVFPYDSGSFETKYFHLDSTISRSYLGWYSSYGTPDSLAGFNRAIPRSDGLPMLTFDTSRHCLRQLICTLFETGRCLPLTPAFAPSEGAEVIYEYGSQYPQTSHLAGLPCGLSYQHDKSRTFVFSFHLWGMNHAEARELIAYMMTEPPQPTPSVLPGGFHLSQNYPNPFNQGTTISFDLSGPARVRLNVFNILGQRVRTLVDEVRQAGPHDVTWDGRDASGTEVASGVYLYRLRAWGTTATKKMVLVR